MDNPEKPATTLGTQGARQRQTKQKTQHRKLKKMSDMDPTKNRGRLEKLMVKCKIYLR